MRTPYLKFNRKTEIAQERRWTLQREMAEVFDVIVAEFASDPSSVACFDLRVVERAIEINKELKAVTQTLETLGFFR